jgi:hypothetical protein
MYFPNGTQNESEHITVDTYNSSHPEQISSIVDRIVRNVIRNVKPETFKINFKGNAILKQQDHWEINEYGEPHEFSSVAETIETFRRRVVKQCNLEDDSVSYTNRPGMRNVVTCELGKHKVALVACAAAGILRYQLERNEILGASRENKFQQKGKYICHMTIHSGTNSNWSGVHDALEKNVINNDLGLKGGKIQLSSRDCSFMKIWYVPKVGKKATIKPRKIQRRTKTRFGAQRRRPLLANNFRENTYSTYKSPTKSNVKKIKWSIFAILVAMLYVFHEIVASANTKGLERKYEEGKELMMFLFFVFVIFLMNLPGCCK